MLNEERKLTYLLLSLYFIDLMIKKYAKILNYENL